MPSWSCWCMSGRTFSPSSGQGSRDVEAMGPRRAYDHPARAAIVSLGVRLDKIDAENSRVCPSRSYPPLHIGHIGLRLDQGLEAIARRAEEQIGQQNPALIRLAGGPGTPRPHGLLGGSLPG